MEQIEIKRPHCAPSVKYRHECCCFHFSALWAFWAGSVRGNRPTWPSLLVAGKVRHFAVRTACQMYFPANFETIDER